MSKLELLNNIPVTPPTVNNKMKPYAYNNDGVNSFLPLYRVAIQLNIFTPVGIAITIVAAVK